MEKKYQYRELKTNEIVEDFMAENYVLDKLGITIEPKGENGTMTLEQLENIQETVNWFFSGNWIKEEIKEVDEDDDIPDLEYELGRYENYHEAIFEGKVY